MPGFWGCDSSSPISSYQAGTTLGNYVINSYYAGSPHDQIIWWGRYFLNRDFPSAEWQGNAESSAFSYALQRNPTPSAGKGWIAPISQPGQGRLSQSYNAYQNGVDDANATAAKIEAAVNAGGLRMPSSSMLYVWLDVEGYSGNRLNGQYYSGWSRTLYNRNYAGRLPYYPCMYVGNTGGPDGNANAQTAKDAFILTAIWAVQPTGCGVSCSSPGPGSYYPNRQSQAPSRLWQYGIATRSGCQSCRNNPVVDLDWSDTSVNGTTGAGVLDYMLFVPVQ